MIRGVLFDMDGLLIDSEPLWQQAEIEIFGSVGLSLTRAQCLETRGRRVDEVVAYWFARSPWQGPSQAAVRDSVMERVIELVRTQGTAKPGVEQVISFMKARHLPIGVASSSHYAIVSVVLNRLGIRAAFDVIHSGEEESSGKPDPAIYRSAARKLGIRAERCLAFEDSPSGVMSAKAAGLQCVAILDAGAVGADRLETECESLAAADLILPSLEAFTRRHWEWLGERSS